MLPFRALGEAGGIAGRPAAHGLPAFPAGTSCTYRDRHLEAAGDPDLYMQVFPGFTPQLLEVIRQANIPPSSRVDALGDLGYVTSGQASGPGFHFVTYDYLAGRTGIELTLKIKGEVPDVEAKLLPIARRVAARLGQSRPSPSRGG